MHLHLDRVRSLKEAGWGMYVFGAGSGNGRQTSLFDYSQPNTFQSALPCHVSTGMTPLSLQASPRPFACLHTSFVEVLGVLDQVKYGVD